MSDIYQECIAESKRIADSFPPPRFYEACSRELEASTAIFNGNGIVRLCLDTITGDLEDNLGHGLEHAEKVAIEAGALALVEYESVKGKETTGDRDRAGVLAQLAGLLHDLRRGEKNHAESGAKAAAPILDGFPVSNEEKVHILEAIVNHEAFAKQSIPVTPYGKLLSDVLYDADKFRWGPDNFTLTLWEMLRSRPVPMKTLIADFPQGMLGIDRIKGTFRSRTGKLFGPEFIALGLQIGDKILAYLERRFR